MFPVRCFAALGGLRHAAVGCRIQSVRCFAVLGGLLPAAVECRIQSVRCFTSLGRLLPAAVGCRMQSVCCFTALGGLSCAYRLLWRKKPKRPARKVGRGAGLKGKRVGKHAVCAAKWGSSKGSFPSVGARIRRFSVA